MKRNLYVGRVLLALVPLLTSSTAFALANRVFVSQRSGNNANSCDNILTPCQTFAGAVLQLNPGGEAIVLDSGGYGPVTITQSVTIEAAPGVTAFIHPPSGDAVTVNASGATVVLRGLSIDGAGGAGSGIKVVAVSALQVENCVIAGFAGDAISLNVGATDTVILRGLDISGSANNGITVNSVGQLFIERCAIRGFSVYGIYFLAQGGTLFMNDDDVRHCGTGVGLFSSGSPQPLLAARGVIRDSYFGDNVFGVWAGDGSIVTATDSVAAGNSIYGFLAQSTGSNDTNMTLERVQAVSNGTGLAARSPGGAFVTLSFAYSVIAQNSEGILNGGGHATVTGTNPGTSRFAGNLNDISGGLNPASVLF